MGRKIDPALIPDHPNLSFEKSFWEQGIKKVGGIDEAGRGALAGPVTAAVVILPPDPGVQQSLAGVRDSKDLTPTEREKLRPRVQAEALAWAVGFASPAEIDAYGIVPATRLAAQRALDELPLSPEHLLLDYLKLPDNPIPQTWLVKGDARSLSIASASILAKTIRDDYLRKMGKKYPGYGFASHKGYGTQAHRQAIRELGHSPVHRMSFGGVKGAKEAEGAEETEGEK